MEDQLQQSSLTIYPNPAHSNLTVNFIASQAADYLLELKDLSGRIVLSENRSAVEGINSIPMDLTTVAKGIYMLNVKSGSEKLITKVLVE